MWEKTLGVVGAGRIGKGVAKRCTGFNMRILCYDQYQDEAFKKECGAEYVDLDTLIRESDFITIHSPLTPETRHMFSTAQFKVMKNEAILVNTARWRYCGLRMPFTRLSHQARSARPAWMLPWTSPRTTAGLCSLSNCILTPHAAQQRKRPAPR